MDSKELCGQSRVECIQGEYSGHSLSDEPQNEKNQGAVIEARG